MRTVGPARAGGVVLRFEHSTIGRLELTFNNDDTVAHQAVRDIRSDPCSFARFFALLSVAVELDGAHGALTYEAVNRLTHGPRPTNVSRARLNKPVEQLLHVLSNAALNWTPPARPGKREPEGIHVDALLHVDVRSRKSRTVRLDARARASLTRYALDIEPDAFLLARPHGRKRPPGPVLTRLRLAALIAARWRDTRATPQPEAFASLLSRFAWISFEHDADGAGASEAAGRVLRPRLREAARALAQDLCDPARYGAGLLSDLQLRSRAPLRSALLLGVAGERGRTAGPAARMQLSVQPTLDEGRLRSADAPLMFGPSRPVERDLIDAVGGGQERGDWVAYGQDSPDCVAHGQDDSVAHGQDDGRAPGPERTSREPEPPVFTGVSRQEVITISALTDGRALLEFAGGFGVVLPATIAAAGCLLDSVAGGQDATVDRCLPAQEWVVSAQQTFGHGQDHPRESLQMSGFSASESSEDSDRPRGERLTAPLAPQTTENPAPPRRDRQAPRAPPPDPDVSDQRRTA